MSLAHSGLRAAVFLDRDGTIIAERHYLADPAQVELFPGAVAALRMLTAAGYALVLVTNQSAIARGLHSESDFLAVQARLRELLQDQGLDWQAAYFCPHHPDFTGPCSCRKPGPGMYRDAARDLGVDLGSSVYIGDKLSDVLPALEFGGLGILVQTGYGSQESAQAPAGIVVAADLTQAAQMVLERPISRPLDLAPDPGKPRMA